MASVHIDQNATCYDNVHVEKLLPSDCGISTEAEVSSKIPSVPSDDEFGEPEIMPRIGDEYQVELPPLDQEFNYMSQTTKCTDSDSVANPRENFVLGMPLMLTWISNVKHDILGACGSSTASESDHESVKNLPVVKKTCQSNQLGYFMVPGLDDEHWSPIEKDSFLLGLYIFEKNFVEVRQFVGTKEMGALQSFYYGKFYGSQEYRRWSHCRKMKSKKYIYGQRIFTGLRQQELLSRILPKVSEECRTALLEASKMFTEEKMSLSEYVSSLKTMVGRSVLVEAVGIGKGKQDLTGMALESLKSNQPIPVRPEIPTGKACSSLTTSEIVKFLSGNYRLSKARSNDLFWEAVWPRLLARGWHSEQPRSKQCLVFLIPGVKKFSRSKLVKGDHYFDSVTDILSEVAREPHLIELDLEGDDGNKKSDEDDIDNDLPTKKQRPCYLQPKTPNRNGILLKFTVVDTSLSNGKVRELRTLPPEFSDTRVVRARAKYSNVETSDDASDVSDTVNEKLLPSKGTPSVTLAAPDSKNKKALKVSNQSRKTSKSSQSSRNKKQGIPDCAVKQHQGIFSACSQKEMSTGLDNGIPTPSCCTSVHEGGLCPDKLSSTSSSRCSPSESVENPQTQTLIDLNLPHVSQESENGAVLTTNSSKEQEKDSVKPNVNPLRHSTRNRPPTSRALEALADGYLTINRKRKTKDANSQDVASRPSQRARSTAVRPNESTNSSEAENGLSNVSTCNTLVKTQAAPQGNEESVSAQCGLSN